MSGISPVKGSLSTIIRSFKSAVSKYAHYNGFADFTWQSRFYDRIIRSEVELSNIRHYIEQNPLKWEMEKNYSTEMDISSIVNNNLSNK
jgi:putative transposase